MPDFKTPALKRKNLFGKIAEASKAGYPIQDIYFDQKEELRARFKIVDNNLKIIFEKDNVQEFRNISVPEINATLKDDRERKDFKSGYEIVKRYLATEQLEEGIDPNPAVTAFWGPKNNKERTSHRYNVYVHFYFKISDLRRLGNDFDERLKTVSGKYISINDSADLFADGTENILPHKQESLRNLQSNRKENYLPTKSDCEKAIESILESGRYGFGKEEIIVWLDAHFDRTNILLKDNWKVITEMNIKIWFK
jgi:hypothetical protein